MKLIKAEDKSAGNQAHSAYSSFGCKTFTGKFRWQLRDTSSGSIVTGYMMMVVLNFIFFFASYRKLLQSATIRWQMLLPFFWAHYVCHFPRRRIFDFAWAYKIGTSLHRGNVDSTDNV